ncbi:MAG: hypothetical protein JHC71_16795, partial [Blastococcus sp.]|nr:hypothetical protein [Blastococcus sp.]
CYAALALVEATLLRDPLGATVPPPGAQAVVGVRLTVVAVAATSAALALAVAAAGWPRTVGPSLNATGSVTVFLALMTLAGGWAQRAVERRMSYEPTRRLGFGNRTPVFLLGTIMFVLAGVLNVQGGYHEVRVTDSVASAELFDVQEAFETWLTTASTCTAAASYAAGGDVVPLVLVAAPGGGIRAAWWADAALHEMTDDDEECSGRRIFAASGVSGGSVGLVAHYAGAREPAEDDGTHVTPLSGEKPLAASMAAMFFRDAPASMLGLSAGWADRAAVLEDAWGDADPGLRQATLLADLQPGPVLEDGAADPDADADWRPLLLLNGTEVSTGCRVVVAPVRTVASAAAGAPGVCRHAVVRPDDPGFVEGAVDVLAFRDQRPCDQADSIDDGDLRASTAALLSARFPYVSPSAELFGCTDGKAVRAGDLDGGAADNSALATILDLWDELEPVVAGHNSAVARCSSDPTAMSCTEMLASVRVAPMLVVLENHYRSTAAPEPVNRQPELSAPIGLLDANRVLVEQAVQEQEALITFSGPLPGETAAAPVRLFRVNPTERPGVAAPLGWTLSDMTRADLRDHLQRAVEVGCSSRPATTGDGSDAGEAPATSPESLGCYREAIGVR